MIYRSHWGSCTGWRRWKVCLLLFSHPLAVTVYLFCPQLTRHPPLNLNRLMWKRPTGGREGKTESKILFKATTKRGTNNVFNFTIFGISLPQNCWTDHVSSTVWQIKHLAVFTGMFPLTPKHDYKRKRKSLMVWTQPCCKGLLRLTRCHHLVVHWRRNVPNKLHTISHTSVIQKP